MVGEGLTMNSGVFVHLYILDKTYMNLWKALVGALLSGSRPVDNEQNNREVYRMAYYNLPHPDPPQSHQQDEAIRLRQRHRCFDHLSR